VARHKMLMLGVAGILAPILFAAYLLWPLPPERLYDADLNVLAESPVEAWCSGTTYMRTRGKGDKKQAAACRDENRAGKSEDKNLRQVILEFCGGAIDAGLGGYTQYSCRDAIDAIRLWPTIDGQLSGAFTDHYPYPSDFITTVTDNAPSTGRPQDRPEQQR
jgi:hypothetical protein